MSEGLVINIFFFYSQIHCNRSPAYISPLLQDFFKVLSLKRVYSLSYWLALFCTSNSAQCWRGRGGNLLKVLGGGGTFFSSHPFFLPCPSSLSIAFTPWLFQDEPDTRNRRVPTEDAAGHPRPETVQADGGRKVQKEASKNLYSLLSPCLSVSRALASLLSFFFCLLKLTNLF